MRKLPAFLKEYFWDVDFRKLDLEKDRIYILKRILDFGDERAVTWMFKNFKKSEMRNFLINFRDCSTKSANYWALILGLPRNEVLCLKERSSRAEKTSWPY